MNVRIIISEVPIMDRTTEQADTLEDSATPVLGTDELGE